MFLKSLLLTNKTSVYIKLSNFDMIQTVPIVSKNDSKLKQEYSSRDTNMDILEMVPEIDVSKKMKPYPSTRNKVMPNIFASEETLFEANRYETQLHPESSGK